MKKVVKKEFYFETKDKVKFEYALVINGITKSEFAERCGISRVQLYNILDGKFSINETVMKNYKSLNRHFARRRR